MGKNTAGKMIEKWAQLGKIIKKSKIVFLRMSKIMKK